MPAGRPPFRPTDEQRQQVETMAGIGLPENEIAIVVGIAPKTLRKHFKLEIQRGMPRANAVAGGKLFQAVQAGAPWAVIFWHKIRMNASEKIRLEHTGKDEGPVRIDVSQLTTAQIVAALAAGGAGDAGGGTGAAPVLSAVVDPEPD